MSELHAMAKDLGVETRKKGHDENGTWCYVLRPDLDIAHECLAKLPQGYGMYRNFSDQWIGCDIYSDDSRVIGTFIECVTALWKRQKAIS